MVVRPRVFASTVTVVALFIAAPPVLAQAASSVSLGAGLSVTAPTNAAAGTDVGAGVAIRLRGGNGIGPTIAMSWFTTPLRTDVAGRQVELGRLSVRPLMLGPGYSRRLSRRIEWDASVTAGIAFGHARRTGPLKEAFAQLGVGHVGVKMDDAFAWKVSTGLWIDLGNQFGLNLSVGHLGVRPGLTITTDAGDTRRSIDLGSTVTSVGITYGIF